MSKVGVVAKIPCQQGKRDEAAAILSGLVEHTGQEAGTAMYVLHADAQQADTLWMYELYDDQAAFDAHMGSDAFKAMFSELAGLIDGGAEMHVLSPLSGKGL